MRRRRRRGMQVNELSLVPMADLLSNTVGALVFIMIFTVLAAGGVVVIKRLPLEHSTKAKPMNFVCAGGRLIPLNNPDLMKRLIDKWGKPYSIFAIRSWIERFNDLQVEDEYFTAKGESKIVSRSPYISVLLIPKEGKGETRREVDQENSEFRKLLTRNNPGDSFVYFFVKPDSLEVFYKAREMAIGKMGFSTGWAPLGQDESLRFGRYGREPKAQ